MAGAQPLDIALATERIQLAAAQLARTRVYWLPTVYLGGDYFRHDGQIQDVAGNVAGTSKSSFMVGAGPSLVFAVTDAIFAPLAARQTLRAREADLQATRNDTLLAVAEAYFNVQEAKGDLAGAEDAARHAQEMVKQAEKFVPSGLIPPIEVVRIRGEAAGRRQAVLAFHERWRVASAELARLLRLDAAALVDPMESPDLQVTLVPLDRCVDDLIPLALMNRPELASQQALVQATLHRLRQERLRPLIPSVLVRGSSTPVTGTLEMGLFGGGRNDSLSNFSARTDLDVQLLWELQNLGFGNRARVNERRAENELALLELFRVQDRIAAEVVQAYAQAQSAVLRVRETEQELKDALEVVRENIKALGQTQGTGRPLILVVRPQEVVAAVQALATAYNHFHGAIADYNRAQFRLYRALGHPAQELTCPPPGGTR
jgi:outer membrane protein TolC